MTENDYSFWFIYSKIDAMCILKFIKCLDISRVSKKIENILSSLSSQEWTHSRQDSQLSRSFPSPGLSQPRTSPDTDHFAILETAIYALSKSRLWWINSQRSEMGSGALWYCHRWRKYYKLSNTLSSSKLIGHRGLH